MTTPSAPSTAHPVPADLVARSSVPTRWPAISERLARRLTTERRIPSWTVGRRVFVSAVDIERYLAGCRRPAV
ncbi:helix-turn-helix domain-containing protein [Frankia gtarii]|uniref:helix-turn-helix domain-containing protein n=1 Tax=Frankia gtarii TaxID=2950102 RepID=UPI0021C1436C|nr:helix-turn-helix domain-containing protein [Frankia gtarii]